MEIEMENTKSLLFISFHAYLKRCETDRVCRCGEGNLSETQAVSNENKALLD